MRVLDCAQGGGCCSVWTGYVRPHNWDISPRPRGPVLAGLTSGGSMEEAGKGVGSDFKKGKESQDPSKS